MSDELTAEAKEVAEAAFDVFKSSLVDYVENQEVDDFAKERIKQYAQEWYWAQRASTESDRQWHESNLKHLTAQGRGQARRLQIGISEEAKDSVGRALEMVGNFLLKLAPKVLKAVLPS